MTDYLKGSGIKFDGTNLRADPKLDFGAKTETFVGNKAADELLTRKYRAPFVLPGAV